METPLLAALALAFGLGLLHALDADHIIAVSALASRRPGFRQAVSFCARWAAGHAVSVLALGGAVLLAGASLPVAVAEQADRLVGVVLIGLGLWVFWDLWRRRIHLHAHAHDGLPAHAHWHLHQRERHEDAVAHTHDHSAVLVGLLHGLAGSAPVIALVPLARLSTPLWGIAYLLVFSAGVLASMTLFGGLIGVCFERSIRVGPRLFPALRAVIAIGSIGAGGAMLV